MPHSDLSSDLFFSRVLGFLERAQRTTRDSLELAGHALKHVGGLLGDIERDGREVVVSAVAFWRSLEAAFAEAAATARATPRIARILKEIGRIAAVYRMYHIRTVWLSPEAAAAELDALHVREAERLRLTLEELGGGVLKVGQFLSCRADLLPPAWIDQLKLLQDQVPPAPEEEVMKLLAAELESLWPDAPASEDPIGRWFSSFDPKPLAAASLAQVHCGVLRHQAGSVAIKIQRPGIDELIDQDRRALAIIADLLAPVFTEVALAPILGEVGRSLDAELDFDAEAKAARRFEAAYATTDTPACIPAIVASTRHLIIMEFVDGERLVPFLDACAPHERDAILEALAKTTAESILVHGLVHADPHPGNFLVRRTEDGTPELVLLDFGATVTLSDEQRRAVTELLPAMLGKNEARVAELLRVLGFSAPDPEAPAKFAMAIAATLVPTNLADIDPRVELEKGLALARQYPGMVVPAAFVQIGRSLAGLGGLFMTYRPSLDLSSILFATLARSTRVSS